MNIGILIYIVIIIALLYYTINRYNYVINVAIFTIMIGLIPNIVLGKSFSTVFLGLIFYFIIGLIFIKILEKINDYFDSPTYFLLLGIIIELFLEKFVLAFIMSLILVM